MMSPMTQGFELDRGLNVSRAVAVRFVLAQPVIRTGLFALTGALLLAMREWRDLYPATAASSMAEAPAPAEPTAAQAAETMRSRPFVGLLVVAAVIGVIVSLAAWCYLESVFQLQQELFKHLPHALGYEQGPPLWWSLPVLAVGALIVALAITRLPGDGGHVPAKGLAAGGLTNPIDLPGVILAGLAGLGLRARAWPRGAAPGARFGSGGAGDSPSEKTSPASGVGGDRGGWELRRAFVRVRLAADRGRDPDRGDRDRRGAAAACAAARAARRRDRHAGLDRNGVVHRAEQPRLRARSAAAAPLRPSRHRPVRLDDRAGDRGRRARETDHAGRAIHPPPGGRDGS